MRRRGSHELAFASISLGLLLGVAFVGCSMGEIDGTDQPPGVNDPDGDRDPGKGDGDDGAGNPHRFPDCEDTSAPALFKNALCLCGDYEGTGNLGVGGKGGEEGVFGINGHFAQLGTQRSRAR